MKFLEPKRRLSEKDSRRFFGNFDNDLTIFLHVFMKKGYICQKFKSAIWNMHGKNESFLWNNHMEKRVLFVYDEYQRYKNRLSLHFYR